MQIQDLEDSINAVPCDSVIIATPMDLRRIVTINKPSTALVYALEDREGSPFLSEEIDRFVNKEWGGRGAGQGK